MRLRLYSAQLGLGFGLKLAILSPRTNYTFVGGPNLQIEEKPLKNIHPCACAMCISSSIQTLTRQRGKGIYLLISIMHFPVCDDVKIKICSDLAEKDLSISQK